MFKSRSTTRLRYINTSKGDTADVGIFSDNAKVTMNSWKLLKSHI